MGASPLSSTDPVMFPFLEAFWDSHGDLRVSARHFRGGGRLGQGCGKKRALWAESVERAHYVRVEMLRLMGSPSTLCVEGGVGEKVCGA